MLKLSTGFTVSECDPDTYNVARIDYIKDAHKPLRQKSKTVSFALQYAGTETTLVRNSGFSLEEARKVVQNYHNLYKTSTEYKLNKLHLATKTGYVVGAFGLKIRTPLLKQVILGTKKTPTAAAAESRTAGNAIFQSWCLLNNRAGSEFMTKVRESKFKHSIKPCAQIHDAQYYLIKEDMEALLFTNEHLVKAVNWNDHPDIYHSDVGLGGEVSIFYPTWANEIMIPNGAGEETIMAKISEAVK